QLWQPPVAAGDFDAKEGDVVCVWSSSPEEKRLLLLGLGEKEKVTAERLRRAWSELTKFCRKQKIKTLNVLLPEIESLPRPIAARAIVEGLFLGNYVYDVHKLEPASLVEQITLIASDVHAIEEIVDKVTKVMAAVWLARDLCNGNADDITPQYLSQIAQEIAKEHPRAEAACHGRSWIEEKGMGLLLAVSRASCREPTFICMHYNGNPSSPDRTCLVGKGITYDTGGLSLKPMASMETQRIDMSGAAIALAVFKAVSALNLHINLSIAIPSCENAIGSMAYKIGDVYKGYSGKTVEVTNTDAEGRLILADAIAYAVKELPISRIIDIATLTGAVDVALGGEAVGLFSNSDFLAEELIASGQRTFERAWRLPLYEEYKELLKSDTADIKNASGRSAGAILGAIFLQEFVEDTPWAHFDIAGCAYNKEAKRYLPKQATAVGVRLLVDYLEHLEKKEAVT
ncbi:MAG: leucyl aminopeptidase, partial [Verrucomicrobia bacterium]|nr:leucyl aminopeptidase [Verrucomicrobiota bacterium]